MTAKQEQKLETKSSSTFFIYDEFGVLNQGLLPPELHMKVFHGGHPEICDACSLQAHCDELFGSGGARCIIHKDGRRWVKVPSLVTLRSLLDGN